jgi:isochorismate synthase
MSLSSPIKSRETSLSVRLPQPVESSLRTMALELAAASTNARHLVTVDLPDPIIDRLVSGGLASLRARATVCWEKPSQQSSLIGLGIAARLVGDRGATLISALQPIVELSTQALVLTTHSAARPRFVGGGRFDPAGQVCDPAWASFGGWQFVVPCFIVATEQGGLVGSCTMSVEPGETPDQVEARLVEALEAALRLDTLTEQLSGAEPAPVALEPSEWESRVSAALLEIGRGQYDKVVLARRTTVEASAANEVGTALVNLSAAYPNCYVFKFHTPDADWIGATPELLVALDGSAVRAASLAGSRPRSVEGREDRRQLTELLADAKERSEHQYVAMALREGLTPLCSDLSSPAAPEVMTLANIHHLYTPFEGHVAPGTHILELVAAIHPTPAVGGWPRSEAVAAIDRLEQLDRGWYSGPIGWIDFSGDGEFAVALRAGLVNSTGAVLFAGAGILAGSVPAGELAETETKLRPLRDALGAS